MDFSRIDNAIDVVKTQSACVAIFGAGGSAGLIGNLARCGVARFKIFEIDSVSGSNIVRQHHDSTDIGRPKGQAVADAIRRINSDAIVELIDDNFLEMDESTLRRHLSDCQLLIFATDRFAAQARGNELALQYNVPAVWIGIYPQGTAGEIIFWHDGLDACFRCLCAKRYEAHAARHHALHSLDPASDGCTILDVTLIDAIAGMIAIGLLTRGSANRFGWLINQLGDRNFIQVQLDSTWTYAGSNPVRKYLGVADECPAYFAWNTIVRADPQGGSLPCPDCENIRGHWFLPIHGIWFRSKANAKARSTTAFEDER